MKSVCFAVVFAVLLLGACAGGKSVTEPDVLTLGNGVGQTAGLPLYPRQMGADAYTGTSQPVPQPELAVPTVRVYNANIKRKSGNTAAEYTTRVRNVATMMARKDNSRGRAANVFAIVEAYYVGSGSWTKHHKREQIPCGQQGQPNWTHECLFNAWVSALSEQLAAPQAGAIGEQYGDVAVLAARSGFTQLPDFRFVNEVIGPGGWGRLQYKMIGVRLSLSGTTNVLPFYAVHVNTKEGGEGRQKDSARDIVRIAKSNFKRGDLTPIVAGDFNFKRGQDPYKIMEEDFTEAAGTCGSDIELVWVGKNSSFPGTAGAPVPHNCEHGSEFSDNAISLTDHNVPYVEFALPSAGPPAPSSSCAHPHRCTGETICCAPRTQDGRCCEPCEPGPVCR